MFTVPLTARKNSNITAAYRANVLNCTRESARVERIGRSQYGHHIVAAFNSLAYLSKLKCFSSEIKRKIGPFWGRGLSNFLKFQHALLDFTYNTLLKFLSRKCCFSRIFVRWHASRRYPPRMDPYSM